MSLSKVFIASAARTPVGSFNGSLSKLSAVQLGIVSSKGALDRAKIDPKQVKECFFGNVLQANNGQAPSKQVALGSGCLNTTPCTTINKVCASGMKAVILGAMSIQMHLNDCVLTGGMESMSNTPFYAQRNLRLGHSGLTDAIIKDGLWDVYNNFHMGNCAELTAKKYKITREDQDEHCIESYKRAKEAWDQGKFKEVVPVTINQRGKETIVDKDEEYLNIKIEKIKQLKPAFVKSEGTVTAANASKINDGASTLILTNEKFHEKHNTRPMCEIIAYSDAACDPKEFTIAPSLAIPIALKRANLELKDISLFELNEAFSVVARVNEKLLNLDPSKCNIWGGAVALGHPIGSSGSRIIVTLAHQLQPGQFGCAAVCNGGGGASAIIIKRLN